MGCVIAGDSHARSAVAGAGAMVGAAKGEQGRHGKEGGKEAAARGRAAGRVRLQADSVHAKGQRAGARERHPAPRQWR